MELIEKVVLAKIEHRSLFAKKYEAALQRADFFEQWYMLNKSNKLKKYIENNNIKRVIIEENNGKFSNTIKKSFADENVEVIDYKQNSNLTTADVMIITKERSYVLKNYMFDNVKAEKILYIKELIDLISRS